jgi:Ca2+-binding RTX toxin-like protein
LHQRKGVDIVSRKLLWRAVAVAIALVSYSLWIGPVAHAGTPTCFGIRSTIVGTPRADVIRGTPRRDVISGLGGNDVISGLGGNDLICGFIGNDRILGGAGDDALSGDAGRDSLNGGRGFDVLFGFGGDDTLNGGAGFDLASFFFAPGPVTADLTLGTATGEGNDSLVSISDLEGSRFDDTLTGDSGENWFHPARGNDAVDGGGGLTDRVAYLFASGPMTVDLNAGTATGQGTDTLTNIEQVEGSRFGDTITGSGGPNVLLGNRGNDTVDGGDGDDHLDGGRGTDTLNGGGGSDTCVNGENNSNCEG